LVAIFTGKEFLRLSCPECTHAWPVPSHLNSLELPLPEKQHVSLEELIERYGRSHVLEDVNCSSQICNKKQNLTASTVISEFPKVLIVHLQRFHWSSDGRSVKRSNLVTFPLTGLSMSALNPENSVKYNLKAIISHLSSHASYGHYVAHTLKEDQWILFNDNSFEPGLRKVCHNSNPVQENQCESMIAYVLVYTIQQ
jgi:ubiquitin C-terminal hydrolase